MELSRIKFVGIGADHTEQNPERIEERIKNGIFVQLQKKALREENIKYILDNNLTEYFALVTDDTMPDVLLREGHLDVILKKAVSLGLSVEQAIYNASYTPARHMGLKTKGSIIPGNDADFLIVGSLDDFSIEQTFTSGKKVYDVNERHLYTAEENIYPIAYFKSIKLEPRSENNYIVKAPIYDGEVQCRVLHVKDGTTFITETVETFKVKNGEIMWEESPYALLTVTERYGQGGSCGYAFVGGDCLKEGAAATSYAHDHHNLLVIGHSKKDMKVAANTIIERQGGISVALNGQIKSIVELPIAGIVSSAPIEKLGKDVEHVSNALRGLGYNHSNVIMSLSTLGLPVSPEFKVTDKGIIDVKKQCIVPLIIE